jgi:Mannosyltransferase putative
MAVLMICHLNLKAQRDSITYKKFYGDKESYWMGHALTSTPFHFVPGYSGGIGTISKKGEKKESDVEKMNEQEKVSYLKGLEDAGEIICTLQLLHILESNGLPLWFNNGLVEYKGVSNDKFLRAEGWVGHDGHWFFDGPSRLPNEVCIEPTEGEYDRKLGDEKPKAKVNRLSQEMSDTLQKLLSEAQRWDRRCVEANLFEVKIAE